MKLLLNVTPWMKRMIGPAFMFMVLLSSVGCYKTKEEFDPYIRQRRLMVEQQLIARGIKDPQVLQAMSKVKRHLFVPLTSRIGSYGDHPLPIGSGQTISQPYIVAFMTEAAKLKKTDRVLEIGTGSGYQAAVLAEIVSEVYTVEIIRELADEASARLRQLRYKTIQVKCGDGYEGWEEYAPYDAIIVTAAPPEVPENLVDQLKIGGRLVIPVGEEDQNLWLITKTPQGVERQSLLPVRFVPMVEGD